jgi:hypothetical protein
MLTMTPADEREMHRLCELLGTLDATLPPSSPLREGLEKGALAIQASFIHGHRAWVEGMYNGLHDPNTELSAKQRASLVRLGIDPDA